MGEEMHIVTKFISGSLVEHWKALPVVGMVLIWLFFSGTKTVRRLPRSRLLAEALLCLFVFGMGYGLLNFGVYGLVDPRNALARPGAFPVDEGELARFAFYGYLSLVVAVMAGVALELVLRRALRERDAR